MHEKNGRFCARKKKPSPGSRSRRHGDMSVVKRRSDKEPGQTSYQRDSSGRLCRTSSLAQPHRSLHPGVYIDLVDSSNDSGGYGGVDSRHHDGGDSGQHGGVDYGHHGYDGSRDQGNDSSDTSSNDSGDPEASVPLFLWLI